MDDFELVRRFWRCEDIDLSSACLPACLPACQPRDQASNNLRREEAPPTSRRASEPGRQPNWLFVSQSVSQAVPEKKVDGGDEDDDDGDDEEHGEEEVDSSRMLRLPSEIIYLRIVFVFVRLLIPVPRGMSSLFRIS